MTLPNHPRSDEAFDFLLMRRRLVDFDGNPVDGDGPDPEQWALADALSDAGVPPDLLSVGRGRMTVLSLDERDFMREKLMREPDANAQLIRALLTVDETSGREPAMGDLLAVLLPGDVAVVYEVVIASADLETPAEHSLGAEAEALVSLARGHAILCRSPDHPIVRTGADEQDPESGHGGSDAKH